MVCDKGEQVTGATLGQAEGRESGQTEGRASRQTEALDPASADAAHAKAALRAQMKAVRANLPVDTWINACAKIRAQLFSLDAWKRATCVLTYLSVGAEADTRGVVQRALAEGKTVALPRCAGPRTLRWYRVDTLEGLERSSLGLDEPPADPAREIDPAQLGADALAVVPGLAFDAANNRLGAGGGYYDAFLQSFTGATAGLCFTAQKVESLAALGALEAHDQPVQAVVAG